MEIKSAKKLLSEIMELCAQLEDPTLNEACEGIWSDIAAAKTMELIVASGRELMVFINEVSETDDFIIDTKLEIESMYNNFLDELGDI